MKSLLSVAGLDPSGGAGLVADVRVAWHHGLHPACVCTALTAQGAQGVTWWEPVSAREVLTQLESVLRAGTVSAIKIGMLGSAALVPPLVDALKQVGGAPIVFDPVLAASRGGSLLIGEVAELLPLCRLATLVTPNLSEVEAFTGVGVSTRSEMRHAARALREAGARAVLVTGGHLEGDPVDVLYDGVQIFEFTGERIVAEEVRGTGCAFSTSIACHLANGLSLDGAVSAAKRYLTDRLRDAYPLGGRLRYLP